MENVYATSSGPLARLANPVAARLRARRSAALVGLTGLQPGHRILDVGCGTLGLRAHHPHLDITGTDLHPRPTYPGPFVQADAASRLPWPDASFDLVVASSLVEHVAADRRSTLAREIRRVGRGYFVQTPAWSFPIEPHALLPAAHWLPVSTRKRYWRVGAQRDWEMIELLRRREVAELFPDALITAERFGPLVKSWQAVRPI